MNPNYNVNALEPTQLQSLVDYMRRIGALRTVPRYLPPGVAYGADPAYLQHLLGLPRSSFSPDYAPYFAPGNTPSQGYHQTYPDYNNLQPWQLQPSIPSPGQYPPNTFEELMMSGERT